MLWSIENAHLTLLLGRFFGVRYFLHVSLNFSSTTKELSVRIPITIIDPNSLSLASNLTAEVATAIEETSKDPEHPQASEKVNKAVYTEYNDPLERRPRTPKNQGKESWTWTAPRSPHLSLIPSPLLPSLRSQEMRLASSTRQLFNNEPFPPRQESLEGSKYSNSGQATRPAVEKTARSSRPLKDIVSPDERRVPPKEVPEADSSVLRFPPRAALHQMEPIQNRDPDGQAVSRSSVDEIHLSPHKAPARRSRPRGVFFDQDSSRITLPKEILEESAIYPSNGAGARPINTDIIHVDGENGFAIPKNLSSTLAEDVSHENQAFVKYHLSQAFQQRRSHSINKPASAKSRASKSHRRVKSRVIFIHAHAANKASSVPRRKFDSLDSEGHHEHTSIEIPSNDGRDVVWETIDEDGDLGEGPGPDVGDNDVHPMRRYESLLKVENWDNGSSHSLVYEPKNMF